jgi:fructose-specific phosphotransferase system IIC component
VPLRAAAPLGAAVPLRPAAPLGAAAPLRAIIAFRLAGQLG